MRANRRSGLLFACFGAKLEGTRHMRMGSVLPPVRPMGRSTCGSDERWWRVNPARLAIRLSVLPILLSVLALVVSPAYSQEMTLEYLGRLNFRSGYPDHMMDARAVDDSLAIVASNLGLALVNVHSLPVDGTESAIFRLPDLNTRDLRIKDGRYVYVILARTHSPGGPGLAVVEIVGSTLVLRNIATEPAVIFEKLDLVGDRLYLTTHSYGLRIYDLSDPLAPSLVGSLSDGLVDATGIHVVGDTAYVADGAGGLKIVDISDEVNPFVAAGEDLSTATGTAQDVTARNGHVYVALGGEGVAFYENGQLGSRVVYDAGTNAKDLSWMGDHLAVAETDGIRVFAVEADGSLSLAVRELVTRRGTNGSHLRIASALESMNGDLLLCADWAATDLYRLAPTSGGTQADITPSLIRIRFAPGGGTADVTLWNTGAATLDITSVVPSVPSFTVSYAGGSIAPGDSVAFTISYDGTPSQGKGVVLFYSNDPDENPLPIQVFGNTEYLDPGEPSVDFTLPSIRRDPDTGDYIEEPFTLSDHLGKIVWFQVYGTW